MSQPRAWYGHQVMWCDHRAHHRGILLGRRPLANPIEGHLSSPGALGCGSQGVYEAPSKPVGAGCGCFVPNGVKQNSSCNKTDQIIRAQVQKQAPKRSNFRTWAHIIPVVNRNHEGFQTNSFTTKIASFNIHITCYISQVVRKSTYNTRSRKLLQIGFIK
jgi:hypothetical protein